MDFLETLQSNLAHHMISRWVKCRKSIFHSSKVGRLWRCSACKKKKTKHRRGKLSLHLRALAVDHLMIWLLAIGSWFCFPPQVSVVIDRHPVRFFVHKRPHVDFFLDIVSQWYDLVVFTASMEIYGAAVADKLDNGRNILNRRWADSEMYLVKLTIVPPIDFTDNIVRPTLGPTRRTCQLFAVI